MAAMTLTLEEEAHNMRGEMSDSERMRTPIFWESKLNEKSLKQAKSKRGQDKSKSVK
jgi:hypothetical protein